jgi:hypothetical protein
MTPKTADFVGTTTRTLKAPDGPGTAALVWCLQDLRNRVTACLAAGSSMGRGALEQSAAEIDAALASSPEAELAAAVGGASLTPRELGVVDAVLGYRWANHGVNPSLGDLGEALGVSKASVQQYLVSLARKGVVTRVAKHAARQIRLVNLDGRA